MRKVSSRIPIPFSLDKRPAKNIEASKRNGKFFIVFVKS